MGDETSSVNGFFKDRLFKVVFGREEHKEWALSLYNAVNGSNYTNAEDITFNTIEDVVYMGMKNDVSFLFLDEVIFFEQQSTINPNMPARFCMYYGKSMEGTFSMLAHAMYSTKLKRLPAPRCICFYNGERDMPEKSIIKLSDAYEGKGDIEVNVTVYNVNYGHNEEILKACQPLSEYSLLIHKIREGVKAGMEPKSAVKRAIRFIPDDALIKPFLIKNEAEVIGMCMTEYDEQKVLEGLRQEAYEDGKEEGREAGRVEAYLELIRQGLISEEVAAKGLGITVEELMEKLG